MAELWHIIRFNLDYFNGDFKTEKQMLCFKLAKALSRKKIPMNTSSYVKSNFNRRRGDGINIAAKKTNYVQSEDDASQKKERTSWRSHAKSYKDWTPMSLLFFETTVYNSYLKSRWIRCCHQTKYMSDCQYYVLGKLHYSVCVCITTWIEHATMPGCSYQIMANAYMMVYDDMNMNCYRHSHSKLSYSPFKEGRSKESSILPPESWKEKSACRSSPNQG